MLTHDKIFRREDGRRIRVTVTLDTDRYRSGEAWDFHVHYCEKGKRTWVAARDHESYTFRRLSQSERRRASREAALRVATAAEVEATMLEL